MMMSRIACIHPPGNLAIMPIVRLSLRAQRMVSIYLKEKYTLSVRTWSSENQNIFTKKK